MRAKVIFTDGWHVSPTVETDDRNLEERLLRCVGGWTPGEAAARLVMVTAAAKGKVAILNTPTGRSFGGTISTIEHRDFWPADGNQAGVFLVYLDDNPRVLFWGGKGFRDSIEFTPGIPQEILFSEDE